MRRLHIGLATASAALLSVAALQAQNAPAPTVNPDSVTAGTYTADSNHTLVGWKVNHFGFNDYFGIFGSVSGTLQLDPKDIGATKLDITVPVSKVTTANQMLTGHLLRDGKDGAAPDFFGSAPADAHFVSTKVEKTSATEATITGNLTLNGVTKPLTISARLAGTGKNPMSQKETIGFHGTAILKRSEFNVNYAIPMVSDNVTLDISAAFEK